MRVLVTGAAGFIGSHLSERLLARGDHVIGLDNLDPYYSPELKRSTVRQLAAGPGGSGFSFVELDIRDADRVRALFAEGPIDAVAHLAGLAGVRYSVSRAVLYTEVNVTGTLNLLDACRDQQLSGPFVFASTSSVYGATTRIPFDESDPCDQPLAPYPATKRSVELFGRAYHHLHGLNFTALRFFTVYGPRNRPDMMAHQLLDSMTRGRMVQLYRGGDMWRDWTYVGDLVRGIMAALERPLGYEVINLGRGEPVLLRDFVRRLEFLAGARANLEEAPMPAADVQATYANIDRAKRLLDYTPTTSLEQGTAALYDWYMNR